MVEDLSVVDSPVKVMEAFMVEHVVDMGVEVVEAVVVAQQFTMEMVPMLVVFLLEELLPYHQQLFYPW